MERNKFIFYKDWWEALRQMPEDMSRSIIEAIMNYALYGIDTEDPQIKFSIYPLVKSQIDRDTTKYEAIISRNRENGKKGGRPKKTHSDLENPENPVGYLETQKTQPNPENPDKPKKANDINKDNDINTDINFPTKVEKLKIDDDDKNAREEKNFEDTLTAELLSPNENTYWEQIAMGLSISALGMSIADIQGMLVPFQEGNKAKGTAHTDLANLKRHYYDWLKIQTDIKRRDKKQEKQRQEQTNKGPLDEFIQKRLG